jgi:site-specific DNA recombinase
MAALFLADLGQKTRRGQIGRVAAGRIPGGLSYGYRRRIDVIDGRGEVERGLREIEPGEAAIVCRIFRDFAAGAGARAIAKALNAERVPSPRGGLWRANAIIGSRKRGNGILHNELYRGRIVYNRQRFIRDPDSRKRVARTNPSDQWKVSEVPELRIVDEQAWAAVQARLGDGEGLPAHRRRRPQKLFSGLLLCGECGGRVTIVGDGRWSCYNARETGTCSNTRTISDSALERRVLGALREQMMQPEAVKAYVTRYHRRRAENGRQARAGRAEVERRIAQVERGVARLLAMVEDEFADMEMVRAKMREAKAERDALTAPLADLDAGETLPLHPGIEEVYRRQIDGLSAALAAGGTKRDQAKAGIRALIDHVAVHPRAEGRGVELELHGRLAEMLQTQKSRPLGDGLNCTAKVVAGARIGRCSTIAALSVARC